VNVKILIIITCSGRKRDGETPGCRWEEKISAINRLSHHKAKALLACRRSLAEKYHHKEGWDLGGSRDSNVRMMPAYRRYDGNLYRRIDSTLWENLERKDSVGVLIVSAMYGLLTPWEAIRKYDLAMEEAYAERYRLSRWWRNQGLGKMLAEFVEGSGASVVHDFLGGKYADITRELKAMAGGKVYLHRHSYPGQGLGSDYHRGEDVRKLLEGAFGHVS